ncbi:MAG: hypothetical protein BWY82_02459 [Verrucomicrobia bacterium ADurb.Bin474]|nr:MAG: hypothetical protein BWY82_02459 [Verrucomicrobia bacterium ADurb.Bin474]
MTPMWPVQAKVTLAAAHVMTAPIIGRKTAGRGVWVRMRLRHASAER